jgi:hypothetical protein
MHTHTHIHAYIHRSGTHQAADTHGGAQGVTGALPQLELMGVPNSSSILYDAAETLGKFVLGFDAHGKAQLKGLGLKIGAGEREGRYLLRLSEFWSVWFVRIMCVCVCMHVCVDEMLRLSES